MVGGFSIFDICARGRHCRARPGGKPRFGRSLILLPGASAYLRRGSRADRDHTYRGEQHKTTDQKHRNDVAAGPVFERSG